MSAPHDADCGCSECFIKASGGSGDRVAIARVEDFVTRGQAAQAAVTAEVLRAEARLRADRACELIERAQNDLARACAELSSLCGGVPVWKATSKMHDRVKSLWYRVDGFRYGRNYRLDDTNVAALKARHKTAGGA